ncbi:MAG: tRNA threonylcarbamoyladenosine dehydratase [Bacteroidota bacterium]
MTHADPRKWSERTLQLIGEESYRRLKDAHVLVVGLGGVGGAAAEMICRAGVGTMTIVDGDIVQESNINRQIPALYSKLGRKKAEVVAERLLAINPELVLHVIPEFIRDERMEEILSTPFDYVVDAIDTLSPKIYLIYHSLNKGLRITSSMGSGGKLDPAQVRISDLKDSFNCRLAYVLRKKLRKLGVEGGFQVVFSTEQVDRELIIPVENEQNKKSTVGTISYMPAIFGCMLASVVIRDLSGKQG